MIDERTYVRAETAVAPALQLVDAVHSQDRRLVRVALAQVTDWQAVAVVLAGMVDDERTARDLLGWTEQLPQPRQLRPCGTHAAYVRHVARREEPCRTCAIAERHYQRNRPDRRAGARNARAAAS
jgi:hypothetical protein